MSFLSAKLIPILKSKSFASLFLRVMGMGFSYLFSMIVAHLYGAEGWGVFSLVFTMVLLGSYVLKFGFDTALLKLTAENETRSQRGNTREIYLAAIKYLTPVVLIACVAFYFSADFLADSVFRKENLELYLPYVSLLTLPAVFILINSEGLRGLGKVNQYALFQNSSVFGLGTLGVILIELTNIGTHSISEILIVYSISTYIIYLISQLSWWSNLRDFTSGETFTFKYLYKVSAPMFWIGVMLMAIGWMDTILLGIFSTEKEVGIYNVALRISNLVIIGKLSIGAVVANQYASLDTVADRQKLESLAQNTSKKGVSFVLAHFFGVIVCFPQFVLGIFGDEFKEGAMLLVVLASGHFINSVFGNPDVFLQMTGHEKKFRTIITLAVAVNLMLNLILIPHIGALGSAFSNLASLTFWHILSTIYIKRKLGIEIVFNPFKSIRT